MRCVLWRAFVGLVVLSADHSFTLLFRALFHFLGKGGLTADDARLSTITSLSSALYHRRSILLQSRNPFGTLHFITSTQPYCTTVHCVALKVTSERFAETLEKQNILNSYTVVSEKKSARKGRPRKKAKRTVKQNLLENSKRRKHLCRLNVFKNCRKKE